jgi:hypothetical protein
MKMDCHENLKIHTLEDTFLKMVSSGKWPNRFTENMLLVQTGRRKYHILIIKQKYEVKVVQNLRKLHSWGNKIQG